MIFLAGSLCSLCWTKFRSQWRYGGDLIMLVSEKGLTAVCVWLQRITDLAANYLFWSVSLSKNQVIKISILSLSFVPSP